MAHRGRLSIPALAALLSALGAAPAAAGGLAEAAFDRGAYEEARSLGEAAGDAENLIIAARALNAIAYFETDRVRARRRANEAQDLAEAAIDQRPDLVEAHLQAAIGLSLRGAHMAPVKAIFLNLPSRARASIDAARALDPDNPFVLSTSAAWNIEVARRGGAAAFGADAALGFEEFARARSLAPDQVSIAYECALRLVADGRPDWRATAMEALAVAIDGTPVGDYEARLKALAEDLEAALDAGPEATAAFIEAHG